MILSRMCLPLYPTHSRIIAAYDYKEIFGYETVLCVLVYDLYVRQSLTICADFVLALHYEKTAVSKHPLGLLACLKIEIKNCLVVFMFFIRTAIVTIVLFVILVTIVSSPARCMHIRGIEYDAVQGICFVRQRSAIHSIDKVAGNKPILCWRYLFPEHAFPVCYVGNLASGLDV